MSDWQAGDLALCIDDSPVKFIRGKREACKPWVENLSKGSVYKVSRVEIIEGIAGLCDEAKIAGGLASRFIKVTPPTQETEQRREAEVVV